MQIIGINHLGLAAKDPVKARWFFVDVLGLTFLGDELVVEQKTMTTMLSSSTGPFESNVPRLEIVAPASGTNDGPISKFLEKKGGGIHHFALTVANLEDALAHLQKHGVRLIDNTPRNGAHQTRIAFVHPESTGGLLVELVEETAKH